MTNYNSNLNRFKEDIKILIQEGNTLLDYFSKKNGFNSFINGYEGWYSESLFVIEVILPKRKNDFTLYYNNSKGICIRNFINRDNDLWGINENNDIKNSKTLFNNQLNILKSAEKSFKSSLFNIKQIVQADLFENELETAKELNKKGFIRGAGAIAGVILEGHLFQVCENHNLKSRKKNPSINDFNQLLKDENVIEVKDWRFIQHLGDLRNLCDHKKEKEPSKNDIIDLIAGVDKISKTIY